MESFTPTPLEERKSQKLGFWDFTKDRLFWVALPFVTAGAAVLFGKLTKFKVFPLDGSPDIVSEIYARGINIFAKKHNLQGGEEAQEWLRKGGWAGQLIEQFGLTDARRELWRKYYFNAFKGAEIAAPFSAYFLWRKKEGNRLDLEDAGNRLKTLEALKPSDEEIATHNEAMRRELAFAAQSGFAPVATIAGGSQAEHHGKLAAPAQFVART